MYALTGVCIHVPSFEKQPEGALSSWKAQWLVMGQIFKAWKWILNKIHLRPLQLQYEEVFLEFSPSDTKIVAYTKFLLINSLIIIKLSYNN